MPDVCSKIKISPELRRIFLKNNEKKPDGTQKNYILLWFYGFFHGSRRVIESSIIKHHDNYFRRYWNTGEFSQDKLEKFRDAVADFIQDFRKLSFTDVDLLTQLTYKDISRFPIMTINNQSIEMEV